MQQNKIFSQGLSLLLSDTVESMSVRLVVFILISRWRTAYGINAPMSFYYRSTSENHHWGPNEGDESHFCDLFLCL
jgi:hypothetical protein